MVSCGFFGRVSVLFSAGLNDLVGRLEKKLEVAWVSVGLSICVSFASVCLALTSLLVW